MPAYKRAFHKARMTVAHPEDEREQQRSRPYNACDIICMCECVAYAFRE
jgi:hypothetical protein